MLDFIRKSSIDTITCPCCREIVPLHTADDYINTDTLETEWHFDFDDVVESRTDKEFRLDHEDGSERNDDSSDAGSESGSEDSCGSDDSADDSGNEQSEENSEKGYSDE